MAWYKVWFDSTLYIFYMMMIYICEYDPSQVIALLVLSIRLALQVIKKYSYKPVLLSHKSIWPCSYYTKIIKFNLWLRKTWSSMDKFFELELFRLIQYKVNTEHVDWDTFDWLIVLKSSRSVCLIKQIINSNCVFNLRHYP